MHSLRFVGGDMWRRELCAARVRARPPGWRSFGALHVTVTLISGFHALRVKNTLHIDLPHANHCGGTARFGAFNHHIKAEVLFGRWDRNWTTRRKNQRKAPAERA